MTQGAGPHAAQLHHLEGSTPTNNVQLPHLPADTGDSFTSDLRRIAESQILADINKGEGRRSLILHRLGEAVGAGQITNHRIIELGVGTGMPLSELKEKIKRDDAVLFNLGTGTTIKNGGPAYSIPPGYPLIDLAEFHPDSKIISTSGSIHFLEIPRIDFHRLFECDVALAGAVQKLIHEAHPAGPMPESAREQIRQTRGQNITALVTRQGIRAVTGPDGIQNILNPNGCCVESPFEARRTSRIIDPIQQRWALIRGVSTLATYMNRGKLTEMARDARSWVDQKGFSEEERTGLALHTFRLMLRKQEKDLIREQLPNLLRAVETAPFEESDRQRLFGRMLEIAWLGDGLKGDNHQVHLKDWDRALSSIVTSGIKRTGGTFPALLKDLDRRIETLFDARSRRQEKGILSIAAQQLPAALYLTPPPGRELPQGDSNLKALVDLQNRLQRGETSAIGGTAYASMRFPDDALEAVSSGTVPVVLYNGRHQDGLAYVHWRFGPRQVNPSVVDNSLAMNLQGAYGSFSRSWVFFRDGSSVLLVSHVGKSRQLSNAGALLLYRNGDNQGVPIEKLHLVDGVQDIAAEIKGDIRDVLQRSAAEIEGKEILGVKVHEAMNLPTQPIILLHPRQLEETQKDDIDIREYHTKSLGVVHVAFVKNRDGGLTRLLIPTVGGSGLYGDTAGHFVDAVFDSELVPNLIPHLLFSATAGGFSGTRNLAEFKRAGVIGIPPVAPEGFLMPQREIHTDAGALPMTTLLAAENEALYDPALRRKLDEALHKASVLQFDRHFCVAHPGDETYQKIDRVVRHNLVASIDVEAEPIQQAILRAREHRPDATFTPIYNFSDDPRSGREERYKMLAYGGPLHDNWKPDLRLNPVLTTLIKIAYDCHVAKAELILS